MRRAAPRPPRVPEKVIQAQCVKLLLSVGGQVWVTGTRRSKDEKDHSTRMSRGIPDVLCALRGRFVFFECKAHRGRLRVEQAAFREAALQCDGVDHVVGGVDELIGYLLTRGLVRTDQVAHYRVPQEARST